MASGQLEVVPFFGFVCAVKEEDSVGWVDGDDEGSVVLLLSMGDGGCWLVH